MDLTITKVYESHSFLMNYNWGGDYSISFVSTFGSDENRDKAVELMKKLGIAAEHIKDISDDLHRYEYYQNWICEIVWK